VSFGDTWPRLLQGSYFGVTSANDRPVGSNNVDR
jgi:hypothetical protein